MESAAIHALIRADVPVLLWGAPGTGKTAWLRAQAALAGAHLEVLIGSTIDPTDVGGLPVPDADGVVQLSPPPWARRVRDALQSGRPAWLLLDELSCAPAAVQAALLRVVYERKAAGIGLSGCRMVGAANPADSAADGGWLSPAMAGRWAHIDWTPDPIAWTTGAITGWGRPLTAAQAAVAASVVAYIARHTSALLGAPGDGAWPSPRSWMATIRGIGALQGGASAPQAHAVAAACIGSDAASEWVSWHAARDLPDPESILRGDRWPERGDRILASALAVVAAAASQHPDREARLGVAASRIGDLRPDLAIAPARALLDVMDHCPDALAGLGRAIRATRGRL